MTTIASWQRGRVTVEETHRGYDVLLHPTPDTVTRVASFVARFRAMERADRLADHEPQDDRTPWEEE